MIVTIDGPAAAGKSSAARSLARRLGFDYLDTGAMYRAVAVAAIRAGFDGSDEEQLQELVSSLRIDVRGDRVFLNGEDVSETIRLPDVTRASRFVADSPAVRRHMVQLQRQAASGRNVVTEGRDQGTVVFPDAICKVFLDAEPDVRARRRFQEMVARGVSTTLDGVRHDQQDRDRCDANRPIGAMVAARDSVRVDSTELTLEQVVDHLEAQVRHVLASSTD